MTRIRYANPLHTRIHHHDPQRDVADRKCDIAANRYLRDQPKARRKPRRTKRIIRKGLADMAYDTYEGKLPSTVLIPRSTK